jgi:uncharacterized caspase-like protein
MAKQFTNGYALLIGVNENAIPGWALPDVAKDLDALAKVLTHLERCAYPAAHVKVLTGQEATRQGILEGLEWLQARIRADTSGNATAVVYYTGHGWRDESGGSADFYLVPYDVKEGKIKSYALPAAAFAEAVGELKPQRLLVVLDCCHAAGMGIKDVAPLPTGYVGAAIAPSLLMEGEKPVAGPGAKGLEALALGKGRAVLSSSSGAQSSYMRKDGKMSIFTYHLIEALTGHAQPQEGATEVLVSDVMSHVWRHVPQSAKTDWNVEQTPDYQVSGNFPVALLLGGQGWSKGQPAPDPLEEIPEEVGMVRKVDTGGGAYVGGSVDTGGGDFVGRDKIVHGDEVRGDKVMGDKVGGDKITVGDISRSTGVAIGRGAQATVTQGLGGDEIARLFAEVYQQIKTRSEDPDVDKEELTETVQKIQGEVARGEEANPHKVERWLKTLAGMADDIFEVTVACLTSPAAGVATVIRKVAQKAKEETA